MLKVTDIKLELMTDIDMFQFIEKGMRGGTSYIAHRHSQAKNKYMKNYGKYKPLKYITYLDANNLYAVANSFSTNSKGLKRSMLIKNVIKQQIKSIQLIIYVAKSLNNRPRNLRNLIIVNY